LIWLEAAPKLTITGFWVTLTVAVAVTVPARLLAVRVYVVVVVGVTLLVPAVATDAIPWLMLTLVGLFATLQVSVLLDPTLTAVGLALNVITGLSTTVTVTSLVTHLVESMVFVAFRV
jgi:hypothetical protein